MFGFSSRAWAIIRFTFGVLGIVIVCAVIMTTGVLSQLGVGVPADEATQPGTEQDAAPSSSDQGESEETSFWDDVLAADMVKAQIDRAAAEEDCDELDRLAELHSHDYGTPEDSRRELLGYITGHQLDVGC